MTQTVDHLIVPTWELLAFGEPAHGEPGFGFVRNRLFEQLVRLGFRSFALESDRVAALTVDDFVRNGVGTLDRAIAEGFSHTFGEHPANRELVAWMHDYNQDQPPAERLAFYGFDAPMETLSAPSPRRYLEHALSYLDLDLQLDHLLGADERWDSAEALMNRVASPGRTAEADQLRCVADDLLTSLYARAPELIKDTSLAAWRDTEVRLTAAQDLLHYHWQAAQPVPDEPRWNRMCATRDALMARNLMDIRGLEAHRGPTLVFANNLHLQRQPSSMQLGPMHLDWNGAGAILAGLLGERYGFIAGSLGASAALGLAEPGPGTYEEVLQRKVDGWGLITDLDDLAGQSRTDQKVEQGYFRLDAETIAAADALLHIADGSAVEH